MSEGKNKDGFFSTLVFCISKIIMTVFPAVHCKRYIRRIVQNGRRTILENCRCFDVIFCFGQMQDSIRKNF